MGFTLVELLIVIVILAILLAVAVPSSIGALDDARASASITSLQNIEKSLSAYEAKYGEWPADQNRGVFPPELSEFYPEEAWNLKPPHGTEWDWNPTWGPADLQPMISVFQNPPPVSEWLEIDKRFDDGDLSTGKLRRHNVRFFSYGI